ncbi:MAG: MraZ N-terminal domain-containing protein, partial [Chitinophagaceae bacterium]
MSLQNITRPCSAAFPSLFTAYPPLFTGNPRLQTYDTSQSGLKPLPVLHFNVFTSVEKLKNEKFGTKVGKSVILCELIQNCFNSLILIDFLGEFEATLDAKGRFLLPAGFKKQLGDESLHFVINRGFEKCLCLY